MIERKKKAIHTNKQIEKRMNENEKLRYTQKGREVERGEK